MMWPPWLTGPSACPCLRDVVWIRSLARESDDCRIRYPEIFRRGRKSAVPSEADIPVINQLPARRRASDLI
jgi:hypothetical protein